MPPSGTAPVSIPQEGFWNPLRRLFALWGLIVLCGFVYTYLYVASTPFAINVVWLVLSLIGLAYTKYLLPWSEKPGRLIFLTWTILVLGGIALTHASFYVSSLLFLVSQIGVLWLVIMGIGHGVTGMIDGKKVYILTAALQFVAAAAVYGALAADPMLFAVQYLVAGVAGAIAMGILIVYG